ncbi:MAG: class II fructose-bisphosphate aldolase [Phycisphaerae bacterium]|nr:class II fructose-bisphosphate aldolase [Phycisphaerae bacterium]
MKIITDRQAVLNVFERTRRAGAALFAPNAELPAEIEGLCMGAQRYADDHRIKDLPLGIGMTGNYADNPQFRKMSTPCKTAEDISGFEGGDVLQGCEIWLRHLACYQDLLGYFPAVRMLPFIDHGWAPDPEDQRLLFNDDIVERMAVIMYDASKLDWDENIALTRKYVERYGKRVVVEAACDKIYDPKDITKLKLSREDQLSKPDRVEQFVRRTGVDLIVPNLGTEHRSVGVGRAERRYERELARQIRDRVGTIQSLHGSSCLGGKVGSTPEDGIVKVNFYTAMAVDAGNRICNLMHAHADKVLKDRNLWINSASYFHDIRRRHVADVCYEMLDTLGYGKLM